MQNTNNILPPNTEFSEEELMQYLNNNLSNEKQHAIEMQMAESAFLADAVEGLQEFDNKKNILNYTEELNKQLLKHTTRKKVRKSKRKFKQQDWIIMAVVIIMMLCLLGYFVINEFEKNNLLNSPK